MTLRLLLVVLIFIYLHQVLGHGRLMEPVSRASAWRKGFKNPADYNDNEGYCGGYSVSHCSFCVSHLICCYRILQQTLNHNFFCCLSFRLWKRSRDQFKKICAQKSNLILGQFCIQFLDIFGNLKSYFKNAKLLGSTDQMNFT